MIIVHLMGGLGNQMFQYAAARSLALHYKTGVEYFFLDRYKYAKRKFELDHFNTDLREIPLSKKIELFTFKKQFRLINKYLNRKPSFVTIEEREYFVFDKDFFNYPANSLLRGFWQSELYFKEYSEIIKKDFQLKDTETLIATDILNKITSNNSVSLHIRRGDYISSFVSNTIHGIIDISYYNKAIEVINNRIDEPIYFIFSDDIKWAKENLKIKQQHYFVDFNFASHQDLYLISLCKHHIIANSSFSWWGAWLSNSNSKIVIAPQKWANNYYPINNYNLIPEGWILI